MDTFITWFTFAVVYGTILSISACGEIINEKAGIYRRINRQRRK